MSWENILKNKYELDRTEIQPFERDAEEEFEMDALRRDIEAERYSESYESPSFKKVERKLAEIINVKIPQDREMLRVLNRSGFIDPDRTRQKLDSALREAYQAERELAKIKKEAKEYADKNPQHGPYNMDELINDVFRDSDSEFATDRGFQMLMGNEFGGMSFGFASGIRSGIKRFEQLFTRDVDYYLQSDYYQ